MVWILLGFLSSISFANHQNIGSGQIIASVAKPDAHLILVCSELPTAMDKDALEKELPTLRVIFFESGYKRGWLGHYGMKDASDLNEFRMFSLESDVVPDFWTAWARSKGGKDPNGFIQFVSAVKSIEKNGRKTQTLDINLYDNEHSGIRIMKMYCSSLQTWI